MPDFRLRPVRWCARGDVFFVEAASSGTVRGAQVTWPAIYCVNLRGDRVIRGRAYYDRAAVLSGFEPELAERRNEAHARVLSEEAARDDLHVRNGLHVDATAIRQELVEPVYSQLACTTSGAVLGVLRPRRTSACPRRLERPVWRCDRRLLPRPLGRDTRLAASLRNLDGSRRSGVFRVANDRFYYHSTWAPPSV
jgi:hypothetical protein